MAFSKRSTAVSLPARKAEANPVIPLKGFVPRRNYLVFGQPVIGDEEIEEVVDSMKRKWIGTGPKVARFEEMFRDYVGSRYAVAVNSCTAALHLSLLVNDIGPGDEVITSPMTFCATANAILHTGATPIFVDIDPDTMNIDVSRIESKISGRTRAIVPIHFAGRPCRMDRILDLAKKYRLAVIEDAAHAIESVYRGLKIGGIGDTTCFSFYVTKNIMTGEGGMITTNRKSVAERLKIYALHGMDKDAWKRYSDEGFKHYHVIYPGYKYNMMDIQAAMGIHQLGRIETLYERREEIWETYNAAFQALPLTLPKPPEPGTRHAYHLYTILVDEAKSRIGRDTLQQLLHRRNIGTGIHFISLHLHPYYRDLYGFRAADFPNARFISERTLSLPLSGGLSDRDVRDVIDAVRGILSRPHGGKRARPRGRKQQRPPSCSARTRDPVPELIP